MRRFPVASRLAAGGILIAGLLAGATVGSGPAMANGCITPAAGSQVDPYLIQNEANLECLFGNASYYWHQGYHFKQTNDIDMSSYVAFIRGIGSDDTTFNGTYDGNGKTITGLQVSGGTSVGMFGVTSGATLTGITLVDDSISGSSDVGGLVGKAKDSTTITNSHVSGQVYATGPNAGGLVGLALDGTVITQSTAAVDIPYGGFGETIAGGLVGRAASTAGPVTISYSSSAGDVTSTGAAGGIVGLGIAPLTIQHSYSTGDDTGYLGAAGGLAGQLMGNDSTSIVIQQSFATGSAWTNSGSSGGLVGTLDDQGPSGLLANAISDSYATGPVHGTHVAGGVVGSVSAAHVSDWTIARTYSVGPLSGSDDSVGGIVATMDLPGAGLVSSSFWNPTDSGALASSPYGTESTASAMRSSALYASAGWNISTSAPTAAVWGSCAAYNGGLPFLQWYAAQQGWACSPPVPPAPTPPGPPTGVTAVAGDASATLTWSAPASSGSYAVSTYLATSTPGGRTCLASALTCEISGLVNGTTYTFSVQALTGAGWGPSSEPSNAVTPVESPVPTIAIEGKRTHRVVSVTGRTTGFGMGALVTPWLKRGAGQPFEQGKDVLVNERGGFTWSRRVGAPVVWVYFTSDDVRSNELKLRAP